jgi:hypothetical protein
MNTLNQLLLQNSCRPRVYISGGISGKPNGNKEAFSAMEAKLHAMGYDVENPRRSAWPGYLSMEDPVQFSIGWSMMMRHAIQQQSKCDSVVFLDEWQGSRGACIEYQMAKVFCQLCFNSNLEIITDGPPRLFSTP